MKRNFVVGLCGGLIGWAMVLLLFNAADVVGAVTSQSQPAVARTQEVSAATLLTSTFTYQGQLKNASGPVTGMCDLAFRLYDDASVGNQVGNAITSTVPITNGFFTVQLDFGVNAFTGDARWLQIAVRCPAGSGSYTTLSPRQALTPAPYALALPGLYTQQNATSPNIIGGYRGNTVAPGVYGSVIGGGGANYWINSMNGSFAVIGGGTGNSANNAFATVGGGYFNAASNQFATVGGGWNNTANGYAATVPGGVSNAATMSYTLAAGRLAQANHAGAFVWADSTNADFASTANDQFLIRTNGGVGINTNQPRTTLEIAKSNGSGLGGTLRLSNPAGGPNAQVALDFATTDVLANAPSARILATDVGNYSADLLFQTKIPGALGNALQTNMKVRTNGYIAIEYLSTGGSTTLCRNGSNDIAACSSSLRYKNNVADLALGLDTIAQLRPVTFDWKDSGQADLGFVAEEVQQLTPLLTTLNAKGQIEGVKYDRITAVLVRGMQEQQAQIVNLQQQNETLQSQNAEQQSQIRDLQAQVSQAQPGTSPAPFNAFNLISVIALLGMVALWWQQRRSQPRGGAR